MSLLEPMIAAIAAGICVPLLLALYLLKLRRRPVRVSTTAFWEAAAEDVQANVPLKWLRVSLLLILHLLIVGLLCLALGRPVSRDAAVAGMRAWVVLDCSASMQAREGGGTRFDDAKQKLKTEAKRLTGAGATVGLITFAAQARVVVTPTTRASVLEDAIDAAAVTDQPGNVAAAITLIRGSISGPDAEAAETAETRAKQERVLATVVTDGASPGNSGGQGIDVRMIAVDDGSSANIGIAAIAAKREVNDPANVRLFVSLTNCGATAVTVPCALRLNGEVVDRFTSDVPPATVKGLGQISVARTVNASGAGVLEVMITREDALAVDNEARVVIDGSSPARILYVSPQAVVEDASKEAPIGGAEWLLAEVLEELKPMVIEKARLAAYSQMSPEQLSRFDAVIFDRVSPAAAPAIPTISFGAGLSEAGLQLGDEQMLNDRALVWERTHPVLRDSPLDSMFVSKTRAIGEAAVRGVKVLARSKVGPLIVARDGNGPRRLVTGFTLGDSNWQLQAGFPVFLSEAIRWVSAKEQGSRSIATGDPVRVEVSGSAGKLAIENGSVKREIDVSASSDGNRRIVVLEPLEKVGTYSVSGLDAEPKQLAVSLTNSAESDLRAIAASADGDENVKRGAGQSGRELWPLCVLIACGLLAIEWFIFGTQARK